MDEYKTLVRENNIPATPQPIAAPENEAVVESYTVVPLCTYCPTDEVGYAPTPLSNSQRTWEEHQPLHTQE